MSEKKKDILIIGGNGFIGSHLTELFAGQGHSVSVLDKFDVMSDVRLQAVNYHTGDYADTAIVEKTLKGKDIVIHLASTTVPASSNDKAIYDVESNLLPTISLLEAMRRTRCNNIVYLSSGGTVYGNAQEVPTPETEAVKPISSYGIVKASIEYYLHMYRNLYGIKYTILRPSNLYGNRQGHSGVQGLINTLMNKIIAKEPITIWGDGTTIRDYLYIKDMVGLFAMLSGQQAEGVFNVGSGKGYSVNEVLKVIIEVTGVKPEINYLPARDFDVKEMVLDCSSIEKEIGWKASTSLKDGIEQMWKNKIPNGR